MLTLALPKTIPGAAPREANPLLCLNNVAHQQRYGPHTRCRPGGHQRPQKPLHAALWIMVAFCACALRLEAPCVCALATAIDPTTKIAAAKVMVILRIISSF